MAELVLKEKLKQRFGEGWSEKFCIDSAGIMADGVSLISQNVIKVLENFYNRKFDESRKCKLFDDKMFDKYDIILTVSLNHKQSLVNRLSKNVKNIFTLSEFVGETGDISDPFMHGLEVYSATFDRINFLLDKLIEKINALEGNMGRIFKIEHPIVKHKLSMIRDKNTDVHRFRELCGDLSVLLCYEALKDCESREVEIETPISRTKGTRILENKITLVAVLRAGLGMLDDLLKMIPEAKVGHIGLYRDEITFKAVEYFSKFPKNINDTDVILLDPMIATGGSIIDSIRLLKKIGVRNIKVLSLIASAQGLDRVVNEFNDIEVYVAAIDSELNERGYIVPGLGDAGDRIFGTH